MKYLLSFPIIAASVCSGMAFAAPQVVVTIKPLHSLVAQITDGVTEPQLLIKQGSPHGYQLKPSDVKAITQADLVVWVGAPMETFLPDVLQKSPQTKNIAWLEQNNVELLKGRKGGLWGEGHHHDHEHHDHEHHDHDHDHHDHEHHDDDHHDHEHHDHEHHDHDHHDHDHHDHEHHDHEHHDHDHHDHEHHDHDSNIDPHVWLSTHNAEIILNAVAANLITIDSANKSQYSANLHRAIDNLHALEKQIRVELDGLENRSFMVFHDAYQYFEKEFNLNAVGAVRATPEHEPGAARVGQLREVFAKNEVKCLFIEPQFPTKLANKLATDTKVKVSMLDPIGAELPADKATYAQLLGNLAHNLQSCLTD